MKRHTNDIKNLFLLFVFGWQTGHLAAQSASSVWQAGNPDGTYRNPVIHADYSDPDAIRVGEDYYLTASSFNQVPGLPLLHSKDLVNWTLIGHALPRLEPEEHYRSVRHGGGVWAPSLRFHKGRFYIYYPDPDFGIYVISARDIRGPWTAPRLLLAGKGLIDPCPLWDDDGKAYLVHAYAGSRAGIKSVLVVRPMNTAGDSVTGNPVMVYDGHEKDPTIEGPKFYKRNGWYYIFAPAGGVRTGWQTVLRSRQVYGPYERRVVMQQGSTNVNGPHQGAWVQTAPGEHWFLHFQDKDAYGRVLHLQPMKWVNDWPVIGTDEDGDGIGEPVLRHPRPRMAKPVPLATVADSDEFNTAAMGRQWQWPANPGEGWAFPTSGGHFRMFSVYQPDTVRSLWHYPALLSQKFPAEKFIATLRLQFHPRHTGERFGLMVTGTAYASLSVVKSGEKILLLYSENARAETGGKESADTIGTVNSPEIYLRVAVKEGASCRFGFSQDGKSFTWTDKPFTAHPGKWVGATLGLFCLRHNPTNDAGYADLDWFRVEPWNE